jgi:hypothetical protein
MFLHWGDYMYPETILELKNTITKNDVIISFTGPFSQGIIEEIGSILRSYIKQDKNLNISPNNIFSVFIEQSQNIKNYEQLLLKENINTILWNSIILIAKKSNKYIILSGNVVEKEDINDIKKQIENLNSLDKENIKKLYNQTLKKSVKNNSDKTGLGFLEMAKRATDKFEYDFIKLNDNFYYFILITKV